MGSDVQAVMAEMIRCKLAEQGRTQSWLAKQSEVSAKHVNLVLNGKADARWPLLEHWATLLGCVFVVALYDPATGSSDVFWPES